MTDIPTDPRHYEEAPMDSEQSSEVPMQELPPSARHRSSEASQTKSTPPNGENGTHHAQESTDSMPHSTNGDKVGNDAAPHDHEAHSNGEAVQSPMAQSSLSGDANGDGAEHKHVDSPPSTADVSSVSVRESVVARSVSASVARRGSAFQTKRVNRWGQIVHDGNEIKEHGDESSANSVNALSTQSAPVPPTPKKRKEKEQLYVDAEREMKWIEMLEDFSKYVVKHPAKVKSRIRKGIPDSVRLLVWPRLLGATAEIESHKGLYQELLAKRSECEETIGRDINRTFPLHILFRKQYEDGQQALDIADKVRDSMGQAVLFNVCKAYSNYDPDLGYCQGLGFVAGLFLMYMSEEEAFWCVERLLRSPRFFLRGLYVPGFPLLQQHFFQLDQFTKRLFPKLHKHMHENGVVPDLYATQWFITLFAYNFPMETVLRIWDIMLHEGIKIIFRVALHVLHKLEKRMLSADFAGIVMALKNVHEERFVSDAETFITEALAIPLSRGQIEKLEKTYQQQKLKEAQHNRR